MATDLLLRIGSDIKGFTDGIGDISGSIEKATSEIEGKFGFLDGLSDKIGGLWGGLALGSVAAAGAAGAALLTIGSDFDGMSDKIRVGTGATGEALASLGNSAKNVFAGVPSSLEQVSTAISDLHTRTGLTGPALEALATQMLNLARLTGQEVGPLIAQTTRVFGDWSIATDRQGGALDYLFKVSQSTGSSVGQLSERIVQFGGPMRQLGFDFETAAALLGKFEKEGVNTELVMGSLRIALGNMAKTGITDAKAALESIVAGIKNAGSAGEANKLALEAFGKKAGPDMAAAVREGRFEIGEFLAKLAASQETVKKAADQTADLSEQFKIFKNSVIVAVGPLATDLFEALNSFAVPALKATGEAIKDVAAWFAGWNLSSWTSSHFGPFLSALQPITDGLKNVWSAVGPLASAFGEVAAKLALLALGEFAREMRALWGAIEPIAGAVGRVSAAFAGWALDRFAGIVRDATQGFVDFIGVLNKIPGLTGAFDGLKNKLDLSAKATKDAKEEATKHGDAVKKAGDAHKDAGPHIDFHTDKNKESKKAAKEAAEEQRNLDSALTALGITAEGGGAKTEKLWQALRTLEQAAKDGKIPMETLEEATRKLHEEFAKADLKTYSDKLKLVGLDAGGPGGAQEKLASLEGALALVRTEVELGLRPVEDLKTATTNYKAEVEKLYPPIYTLKDALSQMTTEVNNAKPPLDLLGTTASSTRDFLAGVAMSTTDAMNAAVLAQGPTAALETAYKNLGITSTAALQDKARIATEAYTTIVTSGTASARDIAAAYEAMRKAQSDANPNYIKGHTDAFDSILKKGVSVFSGPGSIHEKWDLFAKDATKWTGDLAKNAIEKLFKGPSSWAELGITGIGGVGTKWGEFTKNLGETVGPLASQLSTKLFSGEGSWAEIGKSALLSLGAAFAQMAGKWISEATGLASQLSGIFSSIKPPNLGSLGGIIGGGSSGGGGGATAGGGDIAGAVAGAVGSSISGVMGMVTGAVSAISGVIGNFQFAGMNKSLDVIVQHTLQTKNEVENLRRDEWTREGHNMTKWDGLFNFTWTKLDDVINSIRDLGGVTITSSGGGVTEAALQSIEASSIGTNDHLSAFRGEVSTGFYNAAVQGDGILGHLKTLADNTKPTPTGAMSVIAPNVEEGLRNVNLSTQGVFNALAPLRDIRDTLGAMRNNIGVINGIKEAIVGQLGLIYKSMEEVVGSSLKEIARNTYQPYLFFTEVNRALIPATTTAGGARPAASISITYQAGGGAPASGSDAEFRRFADFLARELRRNGV